MSQTSLNETELKKIADRYQGIQWVGVSTLKTMLPELSEQILLHAGPAYGEHDIPQPVLNAAAQAVMYEGKAATIQEAFNLIHQGVFKLSPAQDVGVVTPLAQVVSVSMPVSIIRRGELTMLAPFAESSAPALRFGSVVPTAISAIHHLNDIVQTEIVPTLSTKPVNIAEVIFKALSAGDECHALVSHANEALLEQLPHLSVSSRQLILANPNFVLPILMAASAVLLKTQVSGYVAAGGNGIQFGVKLHGQSAWQVVNAVPPAGQYFMAEPPEALGAIGDSAVVDFAGLGGQLITLATSLSNAWESKLPQNWQKIRDQITDPVTGVVSDQLIQKNHVMPMVHLAILDASGEKGLIGRGAFCPQLS